MNYRDYLIRKSIESAEFDPSNLAPQFIPYFESGKRIEVQFYSEGIPDYVKRGTVSVTTGWKPVFILMHRLSSRGSSEVLGHNDRVTHVINGRKR